MKVIQAPQPVQTDTIADLFLAGGISGCENWQDKVLSTIELDLPNDTLVYNPRRKGDLSKEGDEAAKQIEWEYQAINHSDLISFWFPKETLCPITLFELGKCLHDNILVGVHPEYQRKFDIEQQLKLAREDITIVYSLDELIGQILRYYD